MHNYSMYYEFFLFLILLFAAQTNQEQNFTCCIRRNESISCNNSVFSEIPDPPQEGKYPTGNSGWCKGYGWGNFRSSYVKSLHLEKSNFRTIDRGTFFRYMHIEEIDLSNNKFQRLEANGFLCANRSCPGSLLKKIDLSSNNISYVSWNAFAGLTNLTHLKLEHNHIKYLSPKTFRPVGLLQELNLDNNFLERLNPSLLSPFRNLSGISLKSNLLSALHESLPSSLARKLRYISLNNNRISYITPEFLKNLPYLMRIDLSGNRLKHLPADTFASNPRLYKVVLRDNQISELPENIFSSLCNMRYIDIRNNKLTVAHTSWFANVVFNYYNETSRNDNKARNSVTDGNPWICDCKMRSFSDMLTDILENYKLCAYGDWYRYLNIKCSSPPGEMLVNENGQSRIPLCPKQSPVDEFNNKPSKETNPGIQYQAIVCRNYTPSSFPEFARLSESPHADFPTDLIIYPFLGCLALVAVVLCIVHTARGFNRGKPDESIRGNDNIQYRDSVIREDDSEFSEDSSRTYSLPPSSSSSFISYEPPDETGQARMDNGSTYTGQGYSEVCGSFVYPTDQNRSLYRTRSLDLIYNQVYMDPYTRRPPNPPGELSITNPKRLFEQPLQNPIPRLHEPTRPKEFYASMGVSNEEGYLEPLLQLPPKKMASSIENPNYATIFQFQVKKQTTFCMFGAASPTRPKVVDGPRRPRNDYACRPKSPEYTEMKSLLPLPQPGMQSNPPRPTVMTMRGRCEPPVPYENRDYTLEWFSKNPEHLPSVKYGSQARRKSQHDMPFGGYHYIS